MANYKTFPDGKIKYYWEDYKGNFDLFLADKVDGLNGCRKWLLGVIPDKETVLDIGCGPGHISEIFYRAGRTNGYLGVDNDIKIVELARSLFPSAQFDCQDANFLPYSDNSIDNCILFTVLESLPDFRKPIDEAIRVAKKRVIITLFIPLTDEPTYNTHKVNAHGDYVVEINQHKFITYLNSFNFPVSSGVLEQDEKVQYWWWVIEK